MKFYKRINDLINRALKGEDVTFLLGQMGIILEDIPKPDLSKKLREAYSKDIERKGILKRHGPEAALVILYIMHKLRDERDNRILSAKQLVDLTRERAKDTVVQRFLGWMSSIPTVETKTSKKREIAQAQLNTTIAIEKNAKENHEKISKDVYQLKEDKNGEIILFNKQYNKEKVNFFEK